MAALRLRAATTHSEPNRVTLNKDQVLHHFKDHDPHPLDGVEIVVVGSAGDGLGFFEGC